MAKSKRKSSLIGIDKELYDQLPEKEKGYIIEGYCKEIHQQMKDHVLKGLWEYFTSREMFAMLCGLIAGIIIGHG